MYMKMEEVVERKWGRRWGDGRAEVRGGVGGGQTQLIGIDKKCRVCKEIEMKDGKIENKTTNNDKKCENVEYLTHQLWKKNF